MDENTKNIQSSDIVRWPQNLKKSPGFFRNYLVTSKQTVPVPWKIMNRYKTLRMVLKKWFPLHCAQVSRNTNVPILCLLGQKCIIFQFSSGLKMTSP